MTSWGREKLWLRENLGGGDWLFLHLAIMTRLVIFFNYKLHTCFTHFQVYICSIIKSVRTEKHRERQRAIQRETARHTQRKISPET